MARGNDARFIRQKGANRSYLDLDTGLIISQRQKEKLTRERGTLKPLDPVKLSELRRSRKTYNSLIADVVSLREDKIRDEIENAIYDGDFAKAKALEKKSRTITREVMNDPEIKRAIRDLKTAGEGKAGQEQRKRALKVLGRRKGIPDWVPPGGSDSFRLGKLRKDRLPKSLIEGKPLKSSFKPTRHIITPKTAVKL